METDFDDLTINCVEETKRRGRMGRRRIPDNNDDGTQVFKSKNLAAERRRREKLASRMLELRSAVPIITDMNKATIITDAITYIMEMQKTNEVLTEMLHEMDAEWPEQPDTNHFLVDSTEEMKNWAIEPEVKVTCMDGNKLWVKIVFKKKRGGFTKLMEAMTLLGVDFLDTNVTTSKGAVLVTSCIEGIHGGILAADQVKEFLTEIIKGI